MSDEIESATESSGIEFEIEIDYALGSPRFLQSENLSHLYHSKKKIRQDVDPRGVMEHIWTRESGQFDLGN